MTSNNASGLYPQGIRLFVNRTQDFSSRELLNRVKPYVEWTYNGVTANEINKCIIFEQDIITTKGSSILTVTNLLSVGDSCDYRSDIASLLLETNLCDLNGDELPSCNELVLPLLTHTAVTRPVAYNIVQSEINIYICQYYVMFVQTMECHLSLKKITFKVLL